MHPVTINTTKISTTSSLALTLFEEVEEITRGKAYGTANLLAGLTACELNGYGFSSSAYRSLILSAFTDLVKHVPNATLILPNWTATLWRISQNSGEDAGRNVEVLLTWAQMRWPALIVLK